MPSIRSTVVLLHVQNNLYFCFIDYCEAFDKVKHSDLFENLQGLDIDWQDFQILQILYWELEAVIRVDDDCSEFKSICRGMRQECVFSPDLFNLYSEIILNIEDLECVRMGGKNIIIHRCADDTVLIAVTEKSEA